MNFLPVPKPTTTPVCPSQSSRFDTSRPHITCTADRNLMMPKAGLYRKRRVIEDQDIEVDIWLLMRLGRKHLTPLLQSNFGLVLIRKDLIASKYFSNSGTIGELEVKPRNSSFVDYRNGQQSSIPDYLRARAY